VAGTKETVGNISRKQLLDYKKSQYTASNTIICVAGNLKEDEIVKRIENYFSGISVSSFRKNAKVLENQKKPEILGASKKTDQTHFC
jgi:predicted Zn-dependent peptidase